MKIGIKYCGGCNPEYDRVAAVKRIEDCLSHKIEFVSYRDEGADAILIVAGCSTACVDADQFAKRPVYTITSSKDVENLIESLAGEESRVQS